MVYSRVLVLGTTIIRNGWHIPADDFAFDGMESRWHRITDCNLYSGRKV